MKLHFLPKYAPETNPIERVWYHLVDHGLKVNYTRKLHHFVSVGLPWLLRSALGLEHSGFVVTLAAFLMPLHLLLFCRPIRARIPVVATMFRCLDRPEDRPHTLFRLGTQYAAVCTILPLQGFCDFLADRFRPSVCQIRNRRPETRSYASSAATTV